MRDAVFGIGLCGLVLTGACSTDHDPKTASKPVSEMKADAATDAAVMPDGSDASPASDSGGEHCGIILTSPKSGHWQGSPAWKHVPYEGDVVVETSNRDRLVLFVAGDVPADEDGGVGASGEPALANGARSIIERAAANGDELPLLAPGSKLWLHHDEPLPRGAGAPYGPGPRRFALRTAPDGALIMGSIDVSLPEANEETEPLALSDPRETCTERARICFEDDISITHYSLNVAADAPVRLEDEESADIVLGGLEYTVTLRARRNDYSSLDSGRCGVDLLWTSGIDVSAEVIAKDMKRVLAEVQGGGELPSCRPGNEPEVALSFGPGDRSSSDVIEGAVTYQGKNPDGEYLLFLPPDGIGSFGVSGTDNLFAPTPGETFWLSGTEKAFVLRRSEHGEIVLAAGNYNEFDPSSLDALTQQLGISVITEPNCVYEQNAVVGGRAPAPSYVRDVVFGTDPPLRVKSGDRGRLMLEGRAYDVLPSGIDLNMWITILPAP